MSFFDPIKSAFLHLFGAITGLGHEAWDYIQTNLVPIVEKDAEQALPKLAPIAEAAVLQLATTGHVSNDKRDLAVAQVKQAAAGIGLDVANSVLNLAVETAYSKLKATGQLTASATAPAAGTPSGDQSLPTPPAS